MIFSLANVPTSTSLQGGGRLNGLGCPQCSEPLVDSLITLGTSNTRKACNCTMCDFTSTYNAETLELDKKY